MRVFRMSLQHACLLFGINRQLLRLYRQKECSALLNVNKHLWLVTIPVTEILRLFRPYEVINQLHQIQFCWTRLKNLAYPAGLSAAFGPGGDLNRKETQGGREKEKGKRRRADVVRIP